MALATPRGTNTVSTSDDDPLSSTRRKLCVIDRLLYLEAAIAAGCHLLFIMGLSTKAYKASQEDAYDPNESKSKKRKKSTKGAARRHVTSSSTSQHTNTAAPGMFLAQHTSPDPARVRRQVVAEPRPRYAQVMEIINTMQVRVANLEGEVKVLQDQDVADENGPDLPIQQNIVDGECNREETEVVDVVGAGDPEDTGFEAFNC